MKQRDTMDKREASNLPHPKRKRVWAYPRDRVARDAYDKLFKQQALERRKQQQQQRGSE